VSFGLERVALPGAQEIGKVRNDELMILVSVLCASVGLNCTDLTSLADLISSLSPLTPLPTGPPSLVLYPNHNVRFLDSSDYW